MYIHGHFYNEQNERIEVQILTHGDRSQEVEIGDGEIDWTADPVDITSAVNDTFDVLLCQQASIRLLVRNFVADFFCPSCRDAVVNIYRDGECLFAGFVEPQAYSQGYNEEQDEIELSCIDALTALQYARYRDIGAAGVSYNAVKQGAGQRTFAEILYGIMGGVTAGLDIGGAHAPRCLYDGSKALDGSVSELYRIFERLSINELLFLGSDEDDVWQQAEVAEELLKYLNLHIMQVGHDFYVFSWETLKSPTVIEWFDLLTGRIVMMPHAVTEVHTEHVADTDTTISIGEVYNQLLLTCKTEGIESVVESPLDDDLLTSPYGNKQKYMTEYSCDGDGDASLEAFDAMTHGRATTYEGARETDWFVQVKDNSQWRFPRNGSDNLTEEYCAGKRDQQALPNALARDGGTAIIALGKVERKSAGTDNSPVSKVPMTNYLVVGVNGNGEDAQGKSYPDEASLKAGIPCAVYDGNTSGGVFSPSDEDTTNYIVLSGRIALAPVTAVTDTFKAIYDYKPTLVGMPGAGIGQWRRRTVPSRENKAGRYYTLQWWKADTPTSKPVWDESTVSGLVPLREDVPGEYEFKYSAIGDGGDHVSKVGVLACMLIIGDKCVVETGTAGKPGDFEWRPYKPLEQCASEDEYYQQSFTIGFNPKIGDKLIGTQFALQNNIGYELGIDAEGTAIPIKKTDRVSGKVKFMVLGAVNAGWDVVTRRHPTFFRRTKWSSTTVPLLAHVSSIYVEQFEVKVYSDNGLTNNLGNDDIVYMSDTRETFVNKKEVEFRISSALTSEECRNLGVANGVNMSTPLDVTTGEGVLTIYDSCRGVAGKPERLYVDSYYGEYHAPRIQMSQRMVDRSGGHISPFGLYRQPSLGKTFFVEGISRNLESGVAEMTLKEIEI